MTNRQELDLFVIEVLLGSDPHLILPYIRYRKKQFSLCFQYHENEVFTEAYRRAIGKIEVAESIPNLPAWFKLTIFNIIREYSKNKTSQSNLENKSKIIGDLVGEISIPNWSTQPNLLKLKKALKKLKPQELLILRLRIVEGWSWSEVGDYLVKCGEAGKNTPKFRDSLRQKGKRALDRLRQNYFSA